MYQLNTQSYQWILDMLYGISLIAPLVLFATGTVGDTVVLFVIGVSVGYILHITEKMLIFNNMLQHTVQNKAEQKVDEQAEEAFDGKIKDTIEDTVENSLEETVGQQVQQKAQEEVEEQVDEKIEE